MATTTKKTAAKKATAPKTETKTIDMTDMMSFGASADWAEKAKEQFDTMMSSFGGNFEDMRADAEGFAETAQARMQSVQEQATKTNTRLMEAAQEEMKDAAQLATDLGQAKSFTDVLSVQQAYWTKLFETRMAHAREMTEATVETARETMTPVEMPAFTNMKTFEKFFAFPIKA